MPIPVIILLCVIGMLLITILGYVGFYAVCALLVNPHKIYMKHSDFYRALLNIITMFAIYFSRIHVHLNGFDKIPEGTRFVLVQNHRSKYDPIVTWFCMMERNLAFISKEENLQIPIMGRIIRKCCFMSIDREHPSKAKVTVDNAVALLKDNQVSIGVYPEGTRNYGDGLLPFHNSVFKIAQQAEVPIVISTIRGSDLVKVNAPKRATDVYIDITGVLMPEDIKGLKTREIGAEVARQMLEVLGADKNADRKEC